jgi:SAM-dependent methyltransferase
MTDTIRFTDGGAYERYMGVWSRFAGEAFLDWLSPEPGLRWVDIGCGNGAFTSLILERCAPSGVEGIDPSEEQIAFARERFPSSAASFRKGDAQALPFEDDSFGAAVMPLVIFFLADPALGVAEMKRTVRPGGLVTAYAWDMPGQGFPYAVLTRELKKLDLMVPQTPHPEISEIGALRDLWKACGLLGVETRAFTVSRVFADFEDYWETVQGAPSAGAILGRLSDAQHEHLRQALRRELPAPAEGSFTLSARVHFVAGRVP